MPAEKYHAAWGRNTHFSEGAYAHKTGLVPVEQLDKMRDAGLPEEHYRTHEAEYTNILKSHMAEHGPQGAVVIGYDPVARKATINDGHHRIFAAKELGLTHLPARVERMSHDPDWAKHQGHPVPGHTFEGHVPGEMHPKDIGL